MITLFLIALHFFSLSNSQLRKYFKIAIFVFQEFCLAEGFETCDYNNHGFPKCIKAAIEGALKTLHSPIPELDLPSFDPLRVGPVIVSPGHDILNFDQKFRYLDIYGFTTAKVLNFE